MNARDNTPLTIRDRIKAHLGSVEQASATVIASAIGEASTPSRVVKELNAMRTDALVECEQRGKKKELVYWLAVFRGSGTPHQSPNTVVSAPAAGGDTDSEGGETDISREEMPPADPALLASANRMLSERLAGVAHVLRGSGLPALRNIDDGEDLQPHVAALSGAYQMNRFDYGALVAALDEARALCASTGYNDGTLTNRLMSIVTEVETLRKEVREAMTTLAQLVSNGSDIDPADMELGELVTEAGNQMNDLRQQLEALMRGRAYAANAAGYVMIASKRKPRRTMGAEKAIAAATSAVKGGAQRADVFALLPVGKAVKGAEWKPL